MRLRHRRQRFNDLHPNNRTSYQNRTSKEGRFTPGSLSQALQLGTSGGEPPFLTCSILVACSFFLTCSIR